MKLSTDDEGSYHGGSGRDPGRPDAAQTPMDSPTVSMLQDFEPVVLTG
jgi:hypothetical protein